MFNIPTDDASPAQRIARALLEGFNRHYRLFSENSRAAKQRFEQADWHGQQRAMRERIRFYDQRVRETATRLQTEFAADAQPMDVWQQAKLLYIGLLLDHRQPELAETFFNSVTTKILHRSYFHNDFIFVRPAVSTSYIEIDEALAPRTYRVYYPTPESWRATWLQLVRDFDLQTPFEDLQRDVDDVAAELQRHIDLSRPRTSFQIQVLANLFFRNKGAYIVGRIINGPQQIPIALPVLHTAGGKLAIDTVLHSEDDIVMLFSYARAYFLVEMQVPSAYVQFLRTLMPRKPRAEIYNAVGLHKQGKNSFYRDLLHHLRHSRDHFRIAPGIKGMVMLVFDLPSFPYVFKLIKDNYPPQKKTTREQIKGKYQLVKVHDRVGRMADTLEYSKVALPLSRFEPELIDEMKTHCASLLEFTDGSGGEQEIIIDHAYIERRMTPMNLFLKDATANGDFDAITRATIDYGNAIKDLIAANIFPGDMLWKNFGITRQSKVVFYDYDEIEYLSDCNFRHLPPPPADDAPATPPDKPWFDVGPKDVFPETFGPFLLGNARVRKAFLEHHADLLDPAFWNLHKQRILAGAMLDVFPYDVQRRFVNRRGEPEAGGASAPMQAGAMQTDRG
ncbi:bifunctional isocitrate dehydrogenase kinase/phosphatase [Piscinibacter sakaiensis]|uniref:bifunctional isocitrate dehydrogenase kinase/phosphatase n=1 Tax=Piscinibacter sakaiensis TaxID=1547922 RepID=UPI003AAB6311